MCTLAPVSAALADALDLDLAWRRARESWDRAGVRPAYELELVEHDPDGWLARLDNDVRANRYHPSAIETSDLPKSRGLVRPLAYLVPDDRLMYFALVGACYERIFDAVAWSQGSHDFAHQLAEPAKQSWIRNRYKGWSNFRRASLINLNTFPHVVITDIAAFYENVDLATLISDLNGLGVPSVISSQLSSCLNRWASVNGRGLPQGFEPSDVLSKVYLNSVDRELANRGTVHTRYSDDIRLFCRSSVEAQRILVHVNRALRARGLSLQAAKTRIASADEARVEIEGVIPVLRGILHRLQQELLEDDDVDDPYPPLADLDAALGEDPEEAPLEIIRQAFANYFVEPDAPPFDKTLFRFVLKRLGAALDGTALPHAIRFLRERPDETEAVLRYLWQLVALAPFDEPLAAFLQSDQGRVYDHQTYQIMRWVSNSQHVEIPHLLGIARRYALDPGVSRHIRGVCQKIVGQLGDQSDLELLQRRYSDTRDSLEQAQILCSLRRMETQRRNAFLARARNDGELQARAVAWVRYADSSS